MIHQIQNLAFKFNEIVLRLMETQYYLHIISQKRTVLFIFLHLRLQYVEYNID